MSVENQLFVICTVLYCCICCVTNLIFYSKSRTRYSVTLRYQNREIQKTWTQYNHLSAFLGLTNWHFVSRNKELIGWVFVHSFCFYSPPINSGVFFLPNQQTHCLSVLVSIFLSICFLSLKLVFFLGLLKGIYFFILRCTIRHYHFDI